jgi:F0F1-type ATP synthase delta subunit
MPKKTSHLLSECWPGLNMSKPTIRQIAEALYVVSKKTKPSDLARSIASYVVTEQQTKNLGRILRELERIRLERDGRLEITVNAAHDLTPAITTEIGQLFDAPHKIFIEQTDPSLLGGVTVQAYDKWIDLSVRGKLNRLKNSDYQKTSKG